MSQEQRQKQEHRLFTKRRENTRLTRREKLPWPEGKPFKILSLDGGGIRGIYSASLLSIVEQQLTAGAPISSYFDMIAGTSTGGIIALGLSLNLSADRIEKLYKEDGKQIFKQKWWWRLPIVRWQSLKLLHHIFRPLYDSKRLEHFLHREFGEAVLGQATTRVVVPAFMSPRAEITVFKTDHHPDFKNDWKTKVWEIARATSAAPTYLGGHGYKDVIFLDGGIWANNPIMVAIIDALSAYDISPGQIEILSIGTGNHPFEITLSNAKGGMWEWREAIKAAMFLTTDNVQAQAGLLLGPEQILRLEPEGNAVNIEMDDWETAAGILPEMAEKHYGKFEEDIAYFFMEKVSPRDCFYSADQM